MWPVGVTIPQYKSIQGDPHWSVQGVKEFMSEVKKASAPLPYEITVEGPFTQCQIFSSMKGKNELAAVLYYFEQETGSQSINMKKMETSNSINSIYWSFIYKLIVFNFHGLHKQLKTNIEVKNGLR